MTSEVFITILLMAMVTLTTRLGGFWIMGKIKPSPFIERWMQYLPGSLLVALAAPGVFGGSYKEMLASIMVIAVMILSRSFVVSMAAGIFSLFILRNYFL